MVFCCISYWFPNLSYAFHQAMFRVEITVKGQSRIVLTKIKLHD